MTTVEIWFGSLVSITKPLQNTVKLRAEARVTIQILVATLWCDLKDCFFPTENLQLRNSLLNYVFRSSRPGSLNFWLDYPCMYLQIASLSMSNLLEDKHQENFTCVMSCKHVRINTCFLLEVFCVVCIKRCT